MTLVLTINGRGTLNESKAEIDSLCIYGRNFIVASRSLFLAISDDVKSKKIFLMHTTIIPILIR